MGEQARLFKRHRVEAAGAPRAAARDAPHGEVGTGEGAVLLEREHGVTGATGLEAAAGADPRADGQLPAAHERHEHALHAATCANSCCSSARTARLRSSEV